MKKRILSLLLVFILIITVLPITAAAAGGLSNFTRVNTYKSGTFSDIVSSDWYAAYVQAAYEYDLINGKTADTFDPDSTLTIAEAVKLAVCLHSIYFTGAAQFSNGDPWYTPYVEYALKNGIIDEEYTDYTVAVTRSEFALILSKAFPEEALAVRNTVEGNAIPDVPTGYTYSGAVYLLYRAGILTGSDAVGTFYPNDTIKRSEAAAFVVRMANAAFRQAITLTVSLTTQEIYEKCSPAVFYIVISDINGIQIKTGSGFFIDSSGIAVTNYHVIEGAASAVITTYDGQEYDVAGVYDYDEDYDLALLQIDGSGFTALEMGDSDSVVTGEDAYALGSPLGFTNTFSQGIISSAIRMISGYNYIQTTAAISSGSSGGALLNNAGEVIGVTTMTAVDAQNLNLAVPINLIKQLDSNEFVALTEILPDIKYYDDYYPVPDFGAYAGAAVYKKEDSFDLPIYYYRNSDIDMSVEDALEGYGELLEDNFFEIYGYGVEDGAVISYYYNGVYSMLVSFGEMDVDGVDCVCVHVYAY